MTGTMSCLLIPFAEAWSPFLGLHLSDVSTLKLGMKYCLSLQYLLPLSRISVSIKPIRSKQSD
jgi:hypothetical protein